MESKITALTELNTEQWLLEAEEGREKAGLRKAQSTGKALEKYKKKNGALLKATRREKT